MKDYMGRIGASGDIHRAVLNESDLLERRDEE